MRDKPAAPDKESDADSKSAEVTLEELKKMKKTRRIYEIQKAIDDGDYSVDAEDIAESILE